MKTYKDFTKEQIIESYCNTNKSGRVVCKELGISFRTFSRVLKHLGIPGKKRKSSYTELRDKEWLYKQYYIEKKSTKTIAKEIHATPGAVHSALRWLGYPLRTSEAGFKLRYPKGRFGENAANWQGGRKTSGKYIQLYKPEHPQANVNGYIMEHRLVAEQKLGRPITKKEVVHHINGDKKDNRPENLEVLESKGAHTRHHYIESHGAGNLKKQNTALREALAAIDPNHPLLKE